MLDAMDGLADKSTQAFFCHPLISFTMERQQQIVHFLIELFHPGRVWTLNAFIKDLDKMYALTRIRYTKGGHKTN